MIPHYSTEEAAKRLEAIALDRYNSPHSGVQLSRVLSVASEYEVLNVGNIWKLVQKTDASDASIAYEEVNTIFQGVITKHDLPPFTEKINRNTQAKYLRQSVTISGLGIPAFDKIVSVVFEVHSVFERTIGPNRVERCTAIGTHPKTQFFEIELANRYFDYQGKSSACEVPLTKDIDPHGYLAQVIRSDMFHGEDNVVAYFARRGTSDDNYQYEAVKPIVFSVGDIVEVHATFAAVPLKDDKFKMIVVLHGLTLLDDQFTKKARALRVSEHTARHQIPKPITVLKRKAAYHNELVSVTRAKVERMYISSANDKATSKAAVKGGPPHEMEELERIEEELMGEQDMQQKHSE